MQLLDVLQLSTRVFKTNKLRTFLTVLGIGVGIGTILFLVSLGFGLRKIALEQVASSDSLLALDIFSESSSPIELDKENLEKISALENVVEVSPITTITAQIEIGHLSSGIIVNAVKPSYFSLSGIQTEDGNMFTEGEAHKIVISSATLKAFDILDYKDAISQIASLKLYLPKTDKKEDNDGNFVEEIEEINLENDFEIIGVVEDGSSSYIYIPLSDVDYYLDSLVFSGAKVKVSERDKIEKTREDIVKMGFSVSSLSDTIEEVNKIFQVTQIVLSLFGAVALIVSAIGMFNTMTIALLERTQEIGIMKSLGASNKDVWKLFLFESVIIGLLGGASGVLIGISAGKLFDFGINKLASSLGGESVKIFYTPAEFVLIIIVFSVIVGFLTGLYPARRAARLNPLDALRYK